MDSEKHRRLLRAQKLRRQERKNVVVDAPLKKEYQRGYNKIYHNHYKELLFFTFGLLFLSLLVIGYTYVKTGDIIYKGVSLSGGITVTVGTEGLDTVDMKLLEEKLRLTFPDNDIHTREISEFGQQQGITIEATTKDNSRESLDAIGKEIIAVLNIDDAASRASIEVTGPSLGESFFKQTLKAVLIAFIFMGLVLFLYFGETTGEKIVTLILTTIEALLIWHASNIWIVLLAIIVGVILVVLYIKYSIPSTAVILAAFSTITFTIAVLDIMQFRISTAGIAAFLMLIGYSVDTDILLSTRVLKSSSGTVYERIVSTIKTGLTMTGTTFVAALVSLIFTQSDVIKEIMIIIVIGIIADIIYTWVQNSGILRIYLEHKGRKSDDA